MNITDKLSEEQKEKAREEIAKKVRETFAVGLDLVSNNIKRIGNYRGNKGYFKIYEESYRKSGGF